MIADYFTITKAIMKETEVLADHIKEGVTYSCDRGYVSIELFHTFEKKLSYFVIRQRKNISFDVIEEHKVPNEFGNVKDQIVTLKSDTQKRKFRLIIF